MVHLPDVRLGPRLRGLASKASRTRICTLEFENHRPLYDWFIDAVNEGRTDDGSGPWGKKIHHPQQIEFARLNLTYTVMSKRKLLELVQGRHVSRLGRSRACRRSAGLRRRGYTPEAIRDFCERIGVAKFDSTVDIALLEHCVREDLNKTRPARHGACCGRSRSSSTTIPRARSRSSTRSTTPKTPRPARARCRSRRSSTSSRTISWKTRRKKFFRLCPGQRSAAALRLLHQVHGVVKDAAGKVIELHCTYDPATRGGDAPDGRKVKATLHWVSAAHAIDAEVRLYDHLFTAENPGLHTGNWIDDLNPKSLEVVHAKVEPVLATAAHGQHLPVRSPPGLLRR